MPRSALVKFNFPKDDSPNEGTYELLSGSPAMIKVTVGGVSKPPTQLGNFTPLRLARMIAAEIMQKAKLKRR